MNSSTNRYSLPFPDAASIERVVSNSPGHTAPFDTALDFAVPLGTAVLAPQDGVVITVVDGHSEHGVTQEYAPYANYIQLQHAHDETSDLMHLAKGSAVVKVGDAVTRGQLLAVTGESGWMTAPHLHWFVFRRDKTKAGFTGLEIQYGQGERT